MSIQPGQIEVICGCMFSGKTTALLDRIVHFQDGHGLVYTFKHVSDTRYESECICAHSGRQAEAVPVCHAAEIESLVGVPGLVAIDEGQFFDGALGEICSRLADRGHAMIIAGLDLDCWGLPFEVMGELTVRADRVTQLQARCAVCGRPAERTQRIAPINDESMVAGSAAYEPRCLACFVAPPLALRR